MEAGQSGPHARPGSSEWERQTGQQAS